MQRRTRVGSALGTSRTQGFTIVEVLVAIALFAIVVLVVVVPLTGLFGLTKKSTTQVSATNLAQQWLEQVKGQWQNQSTYTQACITTLPGATSGVTIAIRDEDAQGNNSSAYTPASSFPYAASSYSPVACPATPQTTYAPLRLVTVTAVVNGVSSTLNVEVAW